MVLTYSTSMPVGTRAPDFSLPDTISGKTVTLSKLPAAPATVIMFICNHCPYVKHILPELVKVIKEYQKLENFPSPLVGEGARRADEGYKKVTFIAISANDIVQYPQDSPEEMKKL